MCHSSHHIAWVHVNTREIEHETVKHSQTQSNTVKHSQTQSNTVKHSQTQSNTVKHSQKQGVRNEGMGSEMMQRHANSDLICINR